MSKYDLLLYVYDNQGDTEKKITWCIRAQEKMTFQLNFDDNWPRKSF